MLNQEEIMYQVYLKRNEDKRIRAGHAWVYANEVARIEGKGKNGELAAVYDFDGNFLGKGYINHLSKILVRVMIRDADTAADKAFFKARIKAANDYRLRLGYTDCYRMVFGEADGLPALIVDKYHDLLSVQILSLGMEQNKDVIIEALCELFAPRGIYERNDEALRAKEGLEQNKGWFALPGESHPETTQTEICENGVYYHVDFENGQKTGFFLDQKYNRRAVARLAAGHTVLDCFTHTGSFALNAAKGGAARVTAADISAEAIAMAKRNAERNGLDNMDFLCEDTFALLPRLEKEGSPYDFIILDPPAFTKARRTVENAMRGYKEINYRAMKLLPRGGYLATASCSHFATEELFIKMLRAAAKDAHRQLRQIEVKQQAPDHPILWGVPETNYLKFFLFQVI